MNDSTVSLADRISIARRLRGITQSELAVKAGIPQVQISRIERGSVADPGFSVIAALAAALDISLKSLASKNADILLSQLSSTSVDPDNIAFGTHNGRAFSFAPLSENITGMFYIGSTGAGTIHAQKLIATRKLSQGINVKVLDETGDWTKVFDTYHDFNTAPSMNPLTIYTDGTSTSEGGQKALIMQFFINWLKEFWALDVRDGIGEPLQPDKQVEALKEAFTKAFETNEPTLSDVYDLIQGNDEPIKQLKLYLAELCKGGPYAKYFDTSNTALPEARVYRLPNIPLKEQQLFKSLLRRKLWLVGNTHLFFNSNSNLVGETEEIESFIRTGRKPGNHIDVKLIGNKVNAKTIGMFRMLVLKNQYHSGAMLEELGLSPEQIDRSMRFQRGVGFFVEGEETLIIDFQQAATPEEQEKFSS